MWILLEHRAYRVTHCTFKATTRLSKLEPNPPGSWDYRRAWRWVWGRRRGPSGRWCLWSESDTTQWWPETWRTQNDEDQENTHWTITHRQIVHLDLMLLQTLNSSVRGAAKVSRTSLISSQSSLDLNSWRYLKRQKGLSYWQDRTVDLFTWDTVST